MQPNASGGKGGVRLAACVTMSANARTDSPIQTSTARAFEQAMWNSVNSNAAALSPGSSGRAWKLPVWGDGIVEQSLTTLWYPCDWASVCDDELVFFLPSLTHRSWGSSSAPWHGSASGPSRYLRRALTARLFWAVNVLSQTMPDTRIAARQTLDAIARSGVVSAVPLHEAWSEASTAFSSLYARRAQTGGGRLGWARGGQARSRQAPGGQAPGGQAPGGQALGGHGAAAPGSHGRSVWLFELAVLSCLNRMLADALAPDPASAAGGSEPARPQNGRPLPDILMAAIYASFNAAYVYPNYQHAHQLFMVAAWLGLLARGRAAFLCPSIAEPLADILTGSPAPGADECGEAAALACETVLRRYVHTVCDRDKLLKTALRAVASGASILVKPRDLEQADVAEQPLREVWNRQVPAALASRVPDFLLAW